MTGPHMAHRIVELAMEHMQITLRCWHDPKDIEAFRRHDALMEAIDSAVKHYRPARLKTFPKEVADRAYPGSSRKRHG